MRQQLLEQGQRVFSPVVLAITDWQSIKDLLTSSAKDVFKEVVSKLMTLANNGAALGTTIWIDTQSPKITDWGLGSSSIRDNFDIFAIARIGHDENNIPIGDTNCVTKTAQNPLIVAQESDRSRVLNQFTQLQEGMKNGDIKSSIILSTAGFVRIGITPNFERSALQFESEVKTTPDKNNYGDVNDKVLSLVPNNWMDLKNPDFIIGVKLNKLTPEQIRDSLFELQSLNLIEIDSTLSKIRKI
ncbi:hypothetical protein [Nostoc sp. CCY 9925]|uniref:hypothetical protein n=1 Tax=Nostoc sp. CCY 9925 TaxID=3103865 RepID=UPI0039C62960